MFLMWIACQGDEPSATDTVPADTGPVRGLTVEVDEDQPTVVHVTFETEVPSTAHVEFGRDGAFTRSTPVTSLGTTHRVDLLGNRYGDAVSLRPVAVGEDGTEVTGATVKIQIPALPADVPVFSLTKTSPESRAAAGYVALSFEVGEPGNPQHYIGILDGEAQWVWLHPVARNYGTSGVAPSLDGTALVWCEYDNLRQDLEGYIYQVELDGDVTATTHAPGLHHAIVELPTGEYAYLGRRFLDRAGQATTRDEGVLMGDTVMTVPVGDDGTGAREVFDYIDDWWAGDVDQYWLPLCATRYQDVFGYPVVCDLTHSNSITYVESEGALYTLARWADTMLKIDLATGDLVWQMSGAYSDFTFPGGGGVYNGSFSSELWSQPHYSQMFASGMVVFDNGANATPSTSAIAQYTFDETTGTVQEVWRYSDPHGAFTNQMGDARALSNGNVIASWMSIGRVDEISPDKEVLWSVDTGGVNTRRLVYIEDLYDLRSNDEAQ